MALALISLIAGLLGFFWNPWVQNWINDYGWQGARLRSGIIVGAISIIFTILFIRNSPEDLGMKAYGADEAAKEAEKKETETVVLTGMTRAQAIRTPMFYLIAVVAFISIVTTIVLVSSGVAQYLYAAMRDATGSYEGVIILVGTLLCVQGVITPIIIAVDKKAKAKAAN